MTSDPNQPPPPNEETLAAALRELAASLLASKKSPGRWERSKPVIESLLLVASIVTVILLALQLRDSKKQIEAQARRDYWDVRSALLSTVYDPSDCTLPVGAAPSPSSGDGPSRTMCALDSPNCSVEARVCPPRASLRLRQNAANALIGYFQATPGGGWSSNVSLAHSRLRWLDIVASSNMAGSDFYAADLRCADLDGRTEGKPINFTNASFRLADLRGAKFGESNLTGVKWTGATCPDGTKADDSKGSCEGHLEPKPDLADCGAELYASD